MKPSSRSLLLAVGLALPWLATTSQAAAIQFKGMGSVCTLDSLGACVSPSNVEITAIVSYQVLSAAPSGSDAYSGATYDPAYSQIFQYDDGEPNPWVIAAFSFSWAGGSYTWSPLVGATSVGHYAYTGIYQDSTSVLENVTAKSSSSWDTYTGSFDTGGASQAMSNVAVISQTSTTAGMLNGLDFSLSAQVALYETFFRFSESGASCTHGPNHSAYTCMSTGFRGEFTATSASVIDEGTAQGVPEPGSLLLASLAGLALSATRRRKALAAPAMVTANTQS